MKRWLLLPFGLILVGLTACAPSGAASPVSASATPPVNAVSNPRCAALQVAPTPDTRASDFILSAGRDPNDRLDGPTSAVVTILEYGDYTCPSCAPLAAVLRRLRQEYPDDLRIAYRHFPSDNDKALLAVLAAEAAQRQGKFWPMHDLLYAQQVDWQAKTLSEFEGYLIQQATALGLDPLQFRADLQSSALKTQAETARAQAQNIGLPGTPLLLINGQIYGGPQDYVGLQFTVGMLHLARRQFNTCPPFEIDPQKSYFASLETSVGTLRVKLYADQTPFTVNNFVFLARQGWYNSVPFHRVVPGLMVQTGDPSGTGGGNPGYFIGDEILPALTYDRAGLLGMVNSGPGTNGSQFFITLGPAPQFNGQYTLFGEVVSGLDVLQSLPARMAQFGQIPAAAETILSVTINDE